MKQFYEGFGYRLNPVYPVDYQGTFTRCEKCGESYEADREHVCRWKNSYPWDMKEEAIIEAEGGAE